MPRRSSIALAVLATACAGPRPEPTERSAPVEVESALEAPPQALSEPAPPVATPVESAPAPASAPEPAAPPPKVAE